MEQLIDRARAAMNLLLAFSLLLIWAVIDRPVNFDNAFYSVRYSDDDAALNQSVDNYQRNIRSALKNIDSFEFGNKSSIKQKLEDAEDELTKRERAFTRYKNNELAKIQIEWVNYDLSLLEDTLEEIDESIYNSVLNDEEDIEALLVKIRTNINQAKENLEILSKNSGTTFRELVSKYSETSNILDLREATRKTIKIPYIDRSLENGTAVLALVLLSIGPLLYLYSTVIAMFRIETAPKPPEGVSWIFLQSNLGILLGMIWLLAPFFISVVHVYLEYSASLEEIHPELSLHVESVFNSNTFMTLALSVSYLIITLFLLKNIIQFNRRYWSKTT